MGSGYVNVRSRFQPVLCNRNVVVSSCNATRWLLDIQQRWQTDATIDSNRDDYIICPSVIRSCSVLLVALGVIEFISWLTSYFNGHSGFELAVY